MTYAVANPPALLLVTVTNFGPGQIWGYKSADAAATVAGAGYFTNGGQLGMKVGDLVVVFDTATPLITSHQVLVVGTTGNGAVNLSAGTTIGASS